MTVDFYRQGVICVSSHVLGTGEKPVHEVVATACGDRFGLACSMYIVRHAGISRVPELEPVS
jgi:hypothetical protein